MEKSAIVSSDGVFRYALRRRWRGGFTHQGTVMFIMLNPSTADAENDDPTIRRCLGFAKAWGYTGINVGNLFAYRATDPSELLSAASSGVDVVGCDNDSHLNSMALESERIVAAWGAQAGFNLARAAAVRSEFSANLFYLKRTLTGQPGHPLYLSKHLKPIRWNASK